MKTGIIRTLLGTLALFVPYAAYAAAEFKPIVPLPNLTPQAYSALDFAAYVQLLFRYSITIGAMLAVLMFVYGGFRYMTSEASGGKKNGLDHIRDAVVGLLLLLSVVVILQVINPCILNITTFTAGTDACAAGHGAPTTTNSTQTANGQSNNSASQSVNNAQSGAPISNFAETANPGSMRDCKNVQHICKLPDNTYVPMSGPHCIQGSPQDACAASDKVTFGLSAQGVGYLQSPTPGNVLQVGPQGSTNCPVTVAPFCFAPPQSLTQTHHQPGSGVLTCDSGAHLVDVCDRPISSI